MTYHSKVSDSEALSCTEWIFCYGLLDFKPLFKWNVPRFLLSLCLYIAGMGKEDGMSIQITKRIIASMSYLFFFSVHLSPLASVSMAFIRSFSQLSSSLVIVALWASYVFLLTYNIFTGSKAGSSLPRQLEFIQSPCQTEDWSLPQQVSVEICASLLVAPKYLMIWAINR